MVMVRERGASQEPSPKTRKITRLTETGSRATGTGSSATDDVSNDDVIDDVSNLASFRHLYPTGLVQVVVFVAIKLPEKKKEIHKQYSRK